MEKVYSLGFSFSKVDQVYVKEICRCLPEDVIWYLNDHNTPEEREQFQKIILSSGFRGKFSTYHISC
ncbi:hypothetical protein [Paenibacillus tundrae]|uniref:hypothetical protein n=1 Tax=Paenibacillus tundrae TaxID=528187 RepID=UPI0039B58E22